jgi:hypothetical protein
MERTGETAYGRDFHEGEIPQAKGSDDNPRICRRR